MLVISCSLLYLLIVSAVTPSVVCVLLVANGAQKTQSKKTGTANEKEEEREFTIPTRKQQ